MKNDTLSYAKVDRGEFRTEIISGETLGIMYEHIDVPGGVLDIRYDISEDAEILNVRVKVAQRFRKEVVL